MAQGKAKANKSQNTKNILESLKDIGTGSLDSFKNDLLTPQYEDFFGELLGSSQKNKKFSGELTPGESLSINDVITGKEEENEKLKGQLALERRLVEEERILVERKSGELKVRLSALEGETLKVAQATQSLAEETKVAILQVSANPGEYHIAFLENLLELLKDFRKKIEDASIWLASTNKRALKKNFWGKYKAYGAKFLLAPDHYLQRSAG